jgi:hypothetical protein
MSVHRKINAQVGLISSKQRTRHNWIGTGFYDNNDDFVDSETAGNFVCCRQTDRPCNTHLVT